LDSFLLKPMQRVTRYPLLLSKLLSVSQPKDALYNDTLVALKAIQNQIKDIEDRIRGAELHHRLTEIQRDLVCPPEIATSIPVHASRSNPTFDSLTSSSSRMSIQYSKLLQRIRGKEEGDFAAVASPSLSFRGRTLYYEGPLTLDGFQGNGKVTWINKDKVRKLHGILVSDALLLTRKENNKLHLKEWIPVLDTMVLAQTEQGKSASKLVRAPTWPFSVFTPLAIHTGESDGTFKIATVQGHMYTFTTETKALKEVWVKCLEDRRNSCLKKRLGGLHRVRADFQRKPSKL
jgi:hypothetical protein